MLASLVRIPQDCSLSTEKYLIEAHAHQKKKGKTLRPGSSQAILKGADLTPARKVILIHVALGACSRGQEYDYNKGVKGERERSHGSAH